MKSLVLAMAISDSLRAIPTLRIERQGSSKNRGKNHVPTRSSALTSWLKNCCREICLQLVIHRWQINSSYLTGNKHENYIQVDS
jgi:hypothetical protein